MNEAYLSQLYLKDTAFQNLMQRRVYNVLLIASTYDAFMMEEDGRVEEQIFDEYVSLNLSSPPRVTRVSDFDVAMTELAAKRYDIIIAMPGVDITLPFEKAKEIKQLYPVTPFVVLTPFSREVSRHLRAVDLTAVDYVFSWLVNVDLLVAIIKLIEDKMNAENDINDVGIQMILLVEDSVRFYSSILPTLYNFILHQSKVFSTEALNAHEAMMRMRGRPKVMLARDYEEAKRIYDRYHDNILGVISDVSFARNGKKDMRAGIDLARYLHECDPCLPIIIESSDAANRALVDSFNGTFLDKNSKKLPVDLGEAIMNNFGFGDFVIRDPRTRQEIMRIKDLKDLQNNVFKIPAEALFYYAHHNHISRWLYSRALFPIAQVVKMHRFQDLSEAPAVRQLFFDLIVK
ncbi:MAG: phosphoenolpyruvate synthase, partial [Muribaculaceae bacterium]|nr:phosphoenolpyruvate synthase [Muribaculaceae bacterium]